MSNNRPRLALAVAALFALPSPAWAAATLYPAAASRLALTTATYSQDFDTLAASGTSATLPTGWQVFEGGSSGDGTYAASTGSSTAGNVYSFGAANASDRALGSIASNNLEPIYFGAFFTNRLGAAITALDFAYAGEQWRTGDGIDRLDFQYSLDATNVRDGTWASIAGLTFNQPNTATAGAATDGNAAANRRLLSGGLTGLNIAQGAGFAIRWVDPNVANTDDGLAVDDFSLTATATAAVAAVPEPSTWATMIGGLGLVGLALRGRRGRKVARA